MALDDIEEKIGTENDANEVLTGAYTVKRG